MPAISLVSRPVSNTIAVPLVFASLIKGVSSLSDISKLSRIGSKTIALYLASTVIAVTVGLFLVNTVGPGLGFDKGSVNFSETVKLSTSDKIAAAEKVKGVGPLQFVVDVIPINIFESISDNSNMLQVIFFSIFFGIAIVMLPKKKTVHVRGFFDGLNDIVLKIVDLIMLSAPYGVFALLAGLVVDYGASSSLFVALGKYSLTVFAGLLVMIFLIYPIILAIFTKVKYVDF